MYACAYLKYPQVLVRLKGMKYCFQAILAVGWSYVVKGMYSVNMQNRRLKTG